MTTTRFIPLGLKDDDVEEFFALADELSPATLQLLRDRVVHHYSENGYISGEVLARYASEARVNIEVTTRYGYAADDLAVLFPTTAELLGIIHFLLFAASDWKVVEDLESTLSRGHSVYTAVKSGNGNTARLERRLPEGVAEAVREVVTQSGLAGTHLIKAWNNAYGYDGDASVAYSSAIKAVETLACPLIEPKNRMSTLGTALKALSDQHKSPKSTWDFTNENPKDADESVNTVVSMMKLLWHGQTGRHGSDPSVFTDATVEQAQAAVLLAATLVGWLNNDYLEKTM